MIASDPLILLHTNRRLMDGHAPGLIDFPLEEKHWLGGIMEPFLDELGPEGRDFVIKLNEIEGLYGVYMYDYGAYIHLRASDEDFGRIVLALQKAVGEFLHEDVVGVIVETVDVGYVQQLDYPLAA